jgi:hypothetical protein
MSPSPFMLFPTLRAALAGGVLVLASSLAAAEGGFTATLSAEQKTAAGLASLSDPERAALDQLVTREVAQARQDNPGEPAGTFVARCTEGERRQAGLDRLTPAELATLNELVAAALAARPKPRERPRIKDSEVLNPAPKPEIHGSVTLTYGRGGGGTFHGSALWVDYFDPASGLGLSVGRETFSGRGLDRFYPDYYDLPAFSSDARAVVAAPYRSLNHDDFDYGDGQSFRAATAWDQFGRYHRRP